jgi:hypothetical protein
MKVAMTTTLGLLVALRVFGQANNQAQSSPSKLAPAQVEIAQTDEAARLRNNYVGDEACRPCHQEKVDSFHQTAHYLTSRLPDKKSILGNFVPGANAFATSNAELSFRMDERETGFFQTAVQGIPPYTTEHTEQFGLVIGSGGKGQTYLFWKGDLLYQLPVSYWRDLGWVNSPGYRDGIANFARPIVPRCLECHATHFESIPPPPNRYRKTGFLIGITCEKCHGPGREHVQRESSKPLRSASSAILNPAKLPRERQMDLCAWCHAGAGVGISQAFTYVPGEALDKSLALPKPDPNAQVDVHGSQVELLEKSRCFQLSAMTCLTCHDVHVRQHDLAAFSQVCMNCHKPGTAMFPKLGHRVASDCIDCHMPEEETSLIVFDWNGKKSRPQVRSHWIRIRARTAPPN